MTTFTIDGHDYLDDNGKVYSADGRFEGEVFKSACGEYWIFDGDTSGQVHENEPGAYETARAALIAGNI